MVAKYNLPLILFTQNAIYDLVKVTYYNAFTVFLYKFWSEKACPQEVESWQDGVIGVATGLQLSTPILANKS